MPEIIIFPLNFIRFHFTLILEIYMIISFIYYHERKIYYVARGSERKNK